MFSTSLRSVGAGPARRFASLLLVGLLTIPASAASGQENEPAPETVQDLTREQKKEFLEFLRAGKKAYTNGEFEKAVPFFEKAYDIFPKPALQYRIALCHERAGNLEEALHYYRTFLRQKPETDKRGQVETTIERLEKKIEARSSVRIRIETTPPGARVYVRHDDAQRKTAPRGRTPLTMELVAKPLEIIIKKEGYETLRRQFEVEAGEHYNFNYALPRSYPRGGSKTVALIGTIVGGMGTVMGGTLYGVGIHCGRNRENCSRSLFNTAVVGSYVGGGLGVAGLGTAAVLGLTQNSGRRASRTGPEPAFEFVVTPGYVGLRTRF